MLEHMDTTFIKQLNLKEISYLAQSLAIKHSGNSFNFQKGVASQTIFEISEFIRLEIWNQRNVQSVINALGQRTNEELLYYYPPSEPVPMDDFLERAGLLNYKVALTDPLCFLGYINPDFEDAPHKNPDAYLKHVVEYALLLISLVPWIETNQVILLPGIEQWDYKGWRELGEMNQVMSDNLKLQSGSIGKQIKKHFALENGYRLLSESIRIGQHHYKTDDIKKMFNISSDVEAEKELKLYKEIPKRTRDLEALKNIANNHGIDDATLRDRIERYEEHKIFDYENYVDLSTYDGGLHMATGMPMNMALHTGDKLNAIPITDSELNKLNFDLYTEHLSLSNEYKTQKELVESKVDLDLPFMKGFSPTFIAAQKQSGTAMKLKGLLDDKWKAVKDSSTATSYKSALQKFTEEINSDYKDLKKDYEHIKQQAFAKAGTTITAATEPLWDGTMQHSAWFAVGKSLLVLLGGALTTAKSFDQKKFELKKNPLFIFLEKKKG